MPGRSSAVRDRGVVGGVLPGSAVELIGAVARIEVVVTAAAREDVVAGAAHEVVVAARRR